MPKKILDDDKSKDAEKKVSRRTRTKTQESPPVASAAKSPSTAAKSTKSSSNTNADTVKKVVKKTRAKKSAEPEVEVDNREKIFALDIGTRSVIGIVAVQEENGSLTITATHREEHKTRAMLDGQIHDVPQVAAVIKDVKAELEKQVGKLTSAAVAAAGRALYTVTETAEIEIEGVVTREQERDLEFAAVQSAQSNLAASHTIDDPSSYYCVGFSTIQYELDNIRLKTLVGQRGKKAKATVIATFLPRQVIDSMQSALQSSALEMSALTLEPIAAINVLIPPTMRHLNLVLVDIGAGTSDVAITKNGSVIAYGMVPLAGDEITEAISQKFLLDFNVAEEVKRKAANNQPAAFQDILGSRFDMTADEIIEPIIENIKGLADSIAKTVVELNNNEVPQAVMLVGGGSLTPKLHQFVAKALNLPDNRVAVRNPDIVAGITSVPKELRLPDAVTPLGILKIASINTLHFLSVYVNDVEYNLFHFRDLTVSDALLSTGIQLRKFNGRPGSGLVITVEGDNKVFPGSMGTLAKITVDGEEATLDTPITTNCHIKVIDGLDGQTPTVHLADVVEDTEDFIILVNGKEEHIRPRILVNGEASNLDRILKDGDVVESVAPRSVGEALRSAGYPPTGRKIKYTLNGRQSHYTCSPTILMNDSPVQITLPIHQNDSIEYIANDMPKIGDILNASTLESKIRFYYEDEEYELPAATVELKLNGRPASKNSIIDDDATIEYKSFARLATVSDALLAVDFKPPEAKTRMKFKILVNKRPVDFADPIKSGDKLEVILTPREADPNELTVPPEFETNNPVNKLNDSSSNKSQNQTSSSSSSSTTNHLLNPHFIANSNLNNQTTQLSTQKNKVRTPLKELRERRKLTINDFIRHD